MVKKVAERFCKLFTLSKWVQQTFLFAKWVPQREKGLETLIYSNLFFFQVKKVQEHEHDFQSLPVLIAKQTVRIRNNQRDLEQRFPHKNKFLKVKKQETGLLVIL